jgi:hypothetical protein
MSLAAFPCAYKRTRAKSDETALLRLAESKQRTATDSN